jgi:hypothetical protein
VKSGAAGAVGGGESSSGEQASSPQPEVAPGILRLSTTRAQDKEMLASPPPNATILVDDKFTYRTDEWGRIIKAVAVLDERDPEHPRNIKAQGDLPDKGTEDHSGHIFARIFKGPGDLINLVPMHGVTVNLSAYKKLENKWCSAIRAGAKVEVSVTLKYEGEERRPSHLQVTYQITGKDGSTARPKVQFIRNRRSKDA